jgi:hypothetical protein
MMSDKELSRKVRIAELRVARLLVVLKEQADAGMWFAAAITSQQLSEYLFTLSALQ